MLHLARKAGQSVVIDGNIRVTVDRIRGRVVRLKVEAPTEIRMDRDEVWNRQGVRTNPNNQQPFDGNRRSPEGHRIPGLPDKGGDCMNSAW